MTIEEVHGFHALRVLCASTAPDMSSESKKSNRTDVQPTLQCRVREPIVCAKSEPRGVAQRAQIFTPLLQREPWRTLPWFPFTVPIRGGGRCGDAVSLRGAFAAFFVGAKVLIATVRNSYCNASQIDSRHKIVSSLTYDTGTEAAGVAEARLRLKSK